MNNLERIGNAIEDITVSKKILTIIHDLFNINTIDVYVELTVLIDEILDNIEHNPYIENKTEYFVENFIHGLRPLFCKYGLVIDREEIGLIGINYITNLLMYIESLDPNDVDILDNIMSTDLDPLEKFYLLMETGNIETHTTILEEMEITEMFFDIYLNRVIINKNNVKDNINPTFAIKLGKIHLKNKLETYTHNDVMSGELNTSLNIEKDLAIIKKRLNEYISRHVANDVDNELIATEVYCYINLFTDNIVYYINSKTLDDIYGKLNITNIKEMLRKIHGERS